MSILAAPAAPAKAARKPRDLYTLALSINGTHYGIEPNRDADPTLAVRAFRLVKHSRDECVYDVHRGNDGLVSCTCPDYIARHEGTVSMCKHGRALVALGLLDAPTMGPAPEPKPEPAPPAPAPAVEPAPAPAPAAKPEAAPVDDLDRKRAESFGIKLPAAPSHTVTRRPFGEGLVEPEPAPAACCPEGESEPCAPCKADAADAAGVLADPAPLLTLDEYIDLEAVRYRQLGNGAGYLIADALATLARQVRFYHALTPDQFLARSDAYDAMRWDDQGEPDA